MMRKFDSLELERLYGERTVFYGKDELMITLGKTEDFKLIVPEELSCDCDDRPVLPLMVQVASYELEESLGVMRRQGVFLMTTGVLAQLGNPLLMIVKDPSQANVAMLTYDWRFPEKRRQGMIERFSRLHGAIAHFYVTAEANTKGVDRDIWILPLGGPLSSVMNQYAQLAELKMRIAIGEASSGRQQKNVFKEMCRQEIMKSGLIERLEVLGVRIELEEDCYRVCQDGKMRMELQYREDTVACLLGIEKALAAGLDVTVMLK